ncbi:DUF6973 domain-containing protein [Gordonia sp. (in: high G+C Gram-positive bacteria)]|uniref:DUF6973 domain-containing protein n=1 Tax=Gordonia sp. (in: high G+C Gram-positive bacteria) TaxID=84139 RepID=UPI0039E5E089
MYHCNRVRDEDIQGKSWSESERYFPVKDGYAIDDGRADAARHCIWLGGMTARGSESLARAAANIHEFTSPARPDDPEYSKASEAMDRYNNETGIRIGHESDGDFAEVINKCVTASRSANKIPQEEVADVQNPGGHSLIFFNGK